MIRGVDGVPEMRLLGYQPTRPRLRLLSLPDETIAPSPVALNGSTCALDRAFVRDGWVAFAPNEEVWGVPIPLEGKAFKVGRWWDCVPAGNPRTVWLGVPVHHDPNIGRDYEAPTLLAEYDGAARKTIRTLELAPGLRLDAAVPEGLVMRRENGLRLVRWGDKDGVPMATGDVIAQHGSVVAILDSGPGGCDLLLLDVGTATQAVVTPPAPGSWMRFASFSPHGRWLATGIELQASPDGTSPLRTPSGLALVDCETGQAKLAAGRFVNLASTPVWSHDSQWLIFDAPFDKSLYMCRAGAREPSLIPIVRRRGRPGPLADVTQLTDDLP